MATQDYTKTLVQLVSGSYVPITTGTYYLRAYPFSSNTYTGTHIGSGTWKWSNIQDNDYQIWDGSSQVTSYGTIYIGDKTPTLESLTVDGDVDISGTIMLNGDSLDDSLKVYGQTNFYASVNHNGSDVAHVGNLQVNTLSENSSGNGVTFSHLPKYNGTPSGSSGLVNIGYADGKYLQTSSSNGTQVYTPINFRNIVGFTGTTPPVCNLTPTANNQLTNMGFVVSEINTRIGAFNPSGSYQQGVRQARLIPNATYEPNKVFYDYRNCLVWASGSNAGTQKTVLVQQNENGLSYVPLQAIIETNKMVCDYLHFKGDSVVSLGSDGNIPSGSFGTSELGRIVYEDINFTFDDGDLGNTAEFQKIIFKNCKFYTKTSAFLTFYDCQFEGSCYFDSYLNNQISLVNCTGNPVYAVKPISVSGTNKISVFYSNKFSIGDTTIYDGNDLPDDVELETSPSNYLQINVGGLDYYIPMYFQT